MATIGYYVTMQRTARGEVKGAWLLGPYATHQEALDLVSDGRRLAEDVDPRCAFDRFGTASIHLDRDLSDFPEGRLNAKLRGEGM